VEEKRWKRRGGREEVFIMSFVSVKMAENRVVLVSSTIKTRQHQSSIINPVKHDAL
jgi:hypothetical protein